MKTWEGAKMAQEVFNRYEYKYLITMDQYDKITKILLDKLNLDDFCKKNEKYKIINYYVDTLDYQMIRDSLEQPLYKQKLRVRTYEDVKGEEDFVFFEIKKKYKGIVNKRRCKLTYKEATDLIYENKYPKVSEYVNEQILKEIYYILRRDTYEIKTKISYDRIAYFSDDQKLRISFDFNIKGYDYNHLDKDQTLMEIKTSDSIPIWLVHELNNLDIKRKSFSKYGLDFQNRLKKEKVYE